MTEYEKLSLQLLESIASGISLQLVASNTAIPNEQKAKLVVTVSEWQKNLSGLNDLIGLAILSSPG